jgi:hypothetical protein
VGVVVVGVVVVVVVAQEVFCVSPDLRMSDLRKTGSVCICLAKVYDSATTICAKHLLHYSDCASSRYFSSRYIWDWYFSLTSSAIKQVAALYPAPRFCSSFPHFLSHKFQVSSNGQ